jgi:uncharacterized protein YcfL
MKKIMIAFSTALVLAACGNGNGSAATTDSTQAVVDSAAVTANDSTAAQIVEPAETTGGEQPVKSVEVK